MKANISQGVFSSQFSLVILCMFAFLIVPGWSTTQVNAQDIPYDASEVIQIKKFLECQSMIAGKTNADLLGLNIDDPSNWTSWTDVKPGGSYINPEDRLSEKHALGLEWKNASLAGSIDISGFPYIQTFVLSCSGGTASDRSNFANINISNNPNLISIFIDYVSAGLVEFGGNEKLKSVIIYISDIKTLNLNQPNITTLKTNTLGSTPINVSAFTKLEWLTLAEIDNLTGLDLSPCNKLSQLYITYMKNLRSVNIGSSSYLWDVQIHSTAIDKLDFSTSSAIYSISCKNNPVLTELSIGKGHSELDRVFVEGNSSLQSICIDDQPNLKTLVCEENISLTNLSVTNLPSLKDLNCNSNALVSLDVSGLQSLKRLNICDNQLTKFYSEGISFNILTIDGNKLNEVKATVAGHTVHLKAYGDGGYVGFSSLQDEQNANFIQLSYDNLPDPKNSRFSHIEGTGLPSGTGWKSGFLLNEDVNATLYFDTYVHYLNYFEHPEDNPFFAYGQGIDLSGLFMIGDPIVFPEVFPAPLKTGYELYGWYTDSTLTHEWNFEKDTLRGELTLYPKWLPEGMPVVRSIKRQMPTEENTSANKVTYMVAFSTTVRGVDVSDFVLTTEGSVTGKISSVSAAEGNAISVEVSNITGTGTLRLDVKNTETGIVGGDNNPLAGGYTSGEIYRIGSTTGISGFEILNNNCRTFPNPTSGNVKIYTPNNEPVSRVEVFNIQGKQVLFIDHPRDRNFDLSGLKPGVYFMKIYFKNILYISKVIKK